MVVAEDGGGMGTSARREFLGSRRVQIPGGKVVVVGHPCERV